MSSIQQHNNELVTIYINIEYDNEIAQNDYQELITDKRQEYINKGFSLEQAKHFNRRNERMFEKLDNGQMDCLYIDVSAKVIMPCGHKERFNDGIGGCYVSSRKELEDIIKYYGLIENVKEQIKNKGIEVKEYEIEWKN